MIKIVKKISIKSVIGGRPEVPKKGEPAKMVCQIVGIATGMVKGELDKGPWVKFLGSFQGTDLKTGEISRSGTAFLPHIAESLLTPALMLEGTKMVEFAFNIGVEHSEISATGYEYVVEPLLTPSDSDPLEMLLKKTSTPVLVAPQNVKIKAPK